MAERSRPARNWTQANELIETLRRRWERGVYLDAYAAGGPWAPVSLPVRGPNAAELLDRLDEARRWLERFQRGLSGLDLEYKVVQNRTLGANRIPARVVARTFEQLTAALGVAGDVACFDAILAKTETALPELLGWVRSHPMAALRHAGVWDQALAVVSWIATNDTTGRYLRQIDAQGVDTKFVERHHRLLDELLCTVLPADRFDRGDSAASGSSGFAAAFGFLTKPAYTRLRFLDPALQLAAGISEMTIRTDELVAASPSAATVFVVENEVTYLAFPSLPDSVVVFGSGFALAGLARSGGTSWLADREIVYWGDIDTHGFDILSRLRGVYPAVRSILMDRETLLAHRSQWVEEEAPTHRALPYLTPEEAALYRDLVEDAYGSAVRLEQERVRFSMLEASLRACS